MAGYGIRILYLFCLLYSVHCNFPVPEVNSGGVLLPATRRGRYLANIIRRQGVDGTGIEFNKDADRLNAESKKKIDVLSDELLPYIIAEQDRRVSLYKRVMAAIQSGEKGVTIAEIRNKPPLLIKKGLLFRCPANRLPREPDGTGTLMCEENIEPTQVMYDSCLSAEDSELYFADNKYFFCNRHRTDTPDLPRNGSTVTACAPDERTSLNYTTSKCTLEDTDDVVVHYRYYPDRNNKVSFELDPDREVCEHWNPCQIGYIFSLPSTDQALSAIELWHGYDYEHDELIPEDSITEFVHPNVQNYSISHRIIEKPEGYKLYKLIAKRPLDGFTWDLNNNPFGIEVLVLNKTNNHIVELSMPGNFSDFYYADYYAIFKKIDPTAPGPNKKNVEFLSIVQATTYAPETFLQFLGVHNESLVAPIRCKCKLQNMFLRPHFGSVKNIESDKYSVFTQVDEKRLVISLNVSNISMEESGDYFGTVITHDGREEQIKLFTLEEITVNPEILSLNLKETYDKDIPYACADCVLKDIFCNQQSLINHKDAPVSIGYNKMARFSLLITSDDVNCVYLGVFENMNTKKTIVKPIFILDNVIVRPVAESTIKGPAEGERFQHSVPFTCSSECTVESVSVNGMPLLPASHATLSHFEVDKERNEINIVVPTFSSYFSGYYQVRFVLADKNITKTILKVSGADDADASAGGGNAPSDATADKNGTTTEEGKAAPDEAPKDEAKPDDAKPDDAKPPEGRRLLKAEHDANPTTAMALTTPVNITITTAVSQ